MIMAGSSFEPVGRSYSPANLSDVVRCSFVISELAKRTYAVDDVSVATPESRGRATNAGTAFADT